MKRIESVAALLALVSIPALADSDRRLPYSESVWYPCGPGRRWR